MSKIMNYIAVNPGVECALMIILTIFQALGMLLIIYGLYS